MIGRLDSFRQGTHLGVATSCHPSLLPLPLSCTESPPSCWPSPRGRHSRASRPLRQKELLTYLSRRRGGRGWVLLQKSRESWVCCPLVVVGACVSPCTGFSLGDEIPLSLSIFRAENENSRARQKPLGDSPAVNILGKDWFVVCVVGAHKCPTTTSRIRSSVLLQGRKS